MRLSLRFLLPLVLVLASLAYAVIPLVDTLTLKWFVRDIEIRVQLIAGAMEGDRGRVGNPGYNASKAGFTSYLESLRNRLARRGVGVLTVKAGFVKTDMLKAAQKVMFPITAEKAADDIYRAIRGRKQQIYTPWFWTWVMLAVRNIPSFLFRRMSF